MNPNRREFLQQAFGTAAFFGRARRRQSRQVALSLPCAGTCGRGHEHLV